jgi:hypothetical protein
MTANLMTVYDGTRALGEIEDHLHEGVRANLGIGRGREPLGIYVDRRSPMRAVSQAAKADQAAP